MSKVKIYNAPAVKNMPWQERPEGEFTGAPIWRYKENPIIGRNPLKGEQESLTAQLSLTVMSLSVYSRRADQWNPLHLHGTQQRCNSLEF